MNKKTSKQKNTQKWKTCLKKIQNCTTVLCFLAVCHLFVFSSKEELLSILLGRHIHPKIQSRYIQCMNYGCVFPGAPVLRVIFQVRIWTVQDVFKVWCQIEKHISVFILNFNTLFYVSLQQYVPRMSHVDTDKDTTTHLGRTHPDMYRGVCVLYLKHMFDPFHCSEKNVSLTVHPQRWRKTSTQYQNYSTNTGSCTQWKPASQYFG